MANKWTSTAGPRQTKAVDQALKDLRWRYKAEIEVRDSGRSEIYVMCGSDSEECTAALNALGEQFGWTITRENHKAVIDAAVAATLAVQVPEVDCRTTQEERDERSRILQQHEEERAASKKLFEERRDALLPKVPNGVEALIVAELDEDASDPMSDYHNHHVTRRVLIGFRRGKREDFKQLRAAAGNFEPTKHLGPGLDDWTVLVFCEEDKGPHSYRRREAWDGDAGRPRRFGTETEAKAAIEAAIAQPADEIQVHFAAAHGYEIHCESVEHRENYSMGAGNYLKRGFRDSSGWKVRSASLSDLGHCEDGLPIDEAPPAEAVKQASYEIQKHFHSKRGFEFFLIVLADRVERDTFEALRHSCEKAGGWYSRAWGKTPGGFAFRIQADAEKWASSALVSQPTNDPSSTPSSLPAKLRELADGMQAEIDQKRREPTQNMTPKRSREYASRLIDASDLERGQKALRALADAHERGNVLGRLGDLRTKSAVMPLVRHRTGSNGYYDVHDTGEYADTSPFARALQQLIEGSKSDSDRKAEAENANRQKIAQMERELIGMDIPGFFPTPADLIERMLDAADLDPEQCVLEPSAGKGDIADAIRERKVPVWCCEVSPRLRTILKAKEHFLIDDTDFVKIPAGEWDRIVMNPPFENSQDIQHVQHAYKLLAAGGRLVAIVSNGPFFRSDKASAAFREWLEQVEADVEDLPADSFKGVKAFRQTGVACKLVVINKKIQGHVGTLTNRGKTTFTKFGGGTTKEFEEAEVCESRGEAIDLARSRGNSIYDVPGSVAIDNSGKPDQGDLFSWV